MTRPSSTPTARPLGRGSARTVVIVVSVTGSIIACCAFAFSFGNIWHLARVWGLPPSIAPLVAPMLDLSVVGLLVTVRQLTLHGVPGRRLVGARFLMLVCAVTTWALNIAQSLLDHRWGAAGMDSVAPALLLGWAEVGPTLLRLAATPSGSDRPEQGRSVAQPALAARRGDRAAMATDRGGRWLAPPPDVPRVAPPAPELLGEDASNRGEAA